MIDIFKILRKSNNKGINKELNRLRDSKITELYDLRKVLSFIEKHFCTSLGDVDNVKDTLFFKRESRFYFKGYYILVPDDQKVYDIIVELDKNIEVIRNEIQSLI